MSCNFYYTFISFQLDFHPYKREKGKLKPLFKTEKLNWCKISSKRSNLPFFIKFMIEAAKKAEPSLIHDCPYQGIHEVLKASVTWQFLVLFPTGQFKYDMIFGNGSTKGFEINYEFETT